MISMNKNNNYYYFYHYQVFKIKYRNLNITNVCVLFYMGASFSIFSIHITLIQSLIIYCLVFNLPIFSSNFTSMLTQCTQIKIHTIHYLFKIRYYLIIFF